jgi:AcrR family transcriptional regulator
VIRDRGIARLTAREVAGLAGVSEASVFYHYKDRFGLLTAVFEEGLKPLQALAEGGVHPGADPREVLTLYGNTLEEFLDGVLPLIAAAQSDAELRDSMAAYMAEHDLGPHRGVRAIGDYFAAEQAAGRARADVDPYAVAMMFIGACYTRASQREMPLPSIELPPLESIIDSIVALMAPAGRSV